MILERRHGYSDKEMLEHCKMLSNIINKTKDVPVGRGKTATIVKMRKHNVDKETIDTIDNSVKHYEHLANNPNSFQFRDYQEDIISRGYDIINQYGFLYLAMEVRTGKTLTSLGLAAMINATNVLFITKKKAISSIESDFSTLKPSYNLRVINYESLHIVQDECRWDLIICDEAHSMGAFPKPSIRAKMVHDLVKNLGCKVMLLSGTPTPESYSQMYHQVYGIKNNPFSEFANFYRFCDKYVKVTEKRINGLTIKDYSKGHDTILEKMRPFTINYTQQQAGFMAETTEEVLEVEMKKSTYDMINKLKADLVIQGKTEVILADTPVKLMMKVHQLSSGTIKFESGNSMILDLSKAEFIKEHFDGCKIGIFYKFREELSALQQVFGDNLTTEIDEFNETDKNIALQIVSGREGISLREADYLVYYNIDFSATSYWQSKDRMTTKDRLHNSVYWIFSKGGIEHDIYKAVTKKKDYTVNHFKKLL